MSTPAPALTVVPNLPATPSKRRSGPPAAGWQPRRRAEPEYTGQEKARLRKVCDYLIDSEDEMLHLVSAHPSLQHEIDNVVAVLMRVTRLAHE